MQDAGFTWVVAPVGLGHRPQMKTQPRRPKTTQEANVSTGFQEQAVLNATLALYGLPEPRATNPVGDIAAVLHHFARKLRSGSTPTIAVRGLRVRMSEEDWGDYTAMRERLGL